MGENSTTYSLRLPVRLRVKLERQAAEKKEPLSRYVISLLELGSEQSSTRKDAISELRREASEATSLFAQLIADLTLEGRDVRREHAALLRVMDCLRNLEK